MWTRPQVKIKEQWRINLFKSFPQASNLGRTAHSWGRATCKTALTPQLGPHKRWRGHTQTHGMCTQVWHSHTRAATHTQTRTHTHVHTKHGGESEGLFTLVKRALIELFKDPGGETTSTSVCVCECVCVWVIVLIKVLACACDCMCIRVFVCERVIVLCMRLCPPLLLNGCKLHGCNFLSAVRSLCPLMCSWIGSSSAVMRACDCISCVCMCVCFSVLVYIHLLMASVSFVCDCSATDCLSV